MNLAPLLRQTVQWQVLQSTNGRDDPTYAAAQAMPARSVQRLRDLISPTGEVTTATNRVLMLVTPAIGDLLDGREVIGVESCTDYAGDVVGFWAFTR